MSVWLGTEYRDGGLALVSICIWDGMLRWVVCIGECLFQMMECRDGVLALENVGIRYGVQRWEVGICEYLPKGQNAEMGCWHW